MTKKKAVARDLVAFWLFGTCNNFVYGVMNAAAQDILSKNHGKEEVSEQCEVSIMVRKCLPHSAGLVLLCNIFPAFLIKVLYPLVAWKTTYWQRHAFICAAQAGSLIIVAWADSVALALCGVMLGAISNGMGESTCLALASYYHKHTISTWASGSGIAGLLAAFSYVGLTDPIFLGLTPSVAMMIMLFVPGIFFIAYFIILTSADTSGDVVAPESSQGTVTVPTSPTACDDGDDVEQKVPATMDKKKAIVKSLLKYMLPLFFVYYAEYLINQGLVELIVFDCAHGFGTSTRAQYRWYQVLYQIGTSISRSSSKIVTLNMTWIAIMPVLQVANLAFFFSDAVLGFMPHFATVAVVVLYEGLIGGAAYVNSYSHIHRKVDPSYREFALSVVTLADTTGILAAALSAIPIHNFICTLTVH